MDDDHLQQLQQLIESDPNNPSHHFNFGVLLWEKGSKECRDRAAEHFVTAAKINPNNAEAFKFLGKYYSEVSVDAQRATKCFQRAVTLNPDDPEAGERLCDMLGGSGKESLEIAVCREAAAQSPKAFWAFRRLGYLQVHQKRWPEAAPSLQQAIRGYPTCSELWEALGLAYQRMGMYTAALKSYGRAIELEDSGVFSLIESGNIHLMLGAFRKGIEQFHYALKVSPGNLTAYFGLASGLLGLSKECVASGALNWASVLLQEASAVAIDFTQIAGNLSSAWKLHGDIQIAFAKCFPWEDARSSMSTDVELFKASVGRWKKACISAAFSAKRSYERALHLTPWQANLYIDVAISLDLITSLQETNDSDNFWQLVEKMSLGGLLLEGANSQFWVTLGCLSKNYVLKQHAFIRSLQLDTSLSVAWSYLGKFYREIGETKFSQQAFDRARSIDPSLALPWAGMSMDYHDRKSTPDQAFESCLRAAQMMPLAEFQVGLVSFAAVSGQLISPQVLVAIQQAVKRAPHYPETHNLNGLVYEARSDFHSAIAAYRQARCALSIARDSGAALKSHHVDVSLNLARSLCQAGQVLEAATECEVLMKEGFLDSRGLQIYAVALSHVGKNDQVVAIVKKLAQNISVMEKESAAAALGLMCTLAYCILGLDSAVATIVRGPRELLHSTRLCLRVFALSALDPKKELNSLLPTIFRSISSHNAISEIHSVKALSIMMGDHSRGELEVNKGLAYLKRVLHIYPDSILIRSQLGLFLLSGGGWMASHRAARCVSPMPRHTSNEGWRPASEVHGMSAVACYASCVANHKLTFPTCKDQLVQGGQEILRLQKSLHEEPWSNKAYYLLILNVLQKAREEKFPAHLSMILKRLLCAALSREVYTEEPEQYAYQKFVLLLCASEVSLRSGDHVNSIARSRDAVGCQCNYSDTFFAHLQMCRAYALKEDMLNLRNEYMNCLKLKTSNPIGWISLKYLESRYKLLSDIESVDANFQACSVGREIFWNTWEALYCVVCAQCCMMDHKFLQAEQALEQARSIGPADSCILLLHGAICLELARQRQGSQFLGRAVSSLIRAQENSPYLLPIISMLLGQAEASNGAKSNWGRNLRLEWFSWPAEIRPAEVYFQMHLLTKQSDSGSKDNANIESSQSPNRWIVRAIHLNPSCSRYWKVLKKLVQS